VRGGGRQLTGVNPPEFLANAHGAFVDISLGHDGTDLAFAVMEGVAHLLRSNLEYCRRSVGRVHAMVSTGGGTASAFWTQLKADVCDVLVATAPRAWGHDGISVF
jgi:sugar (pentulose or hexulose) kinase